MAETVARVHTVSAKTVNLTRALVPVSPWDRPVMHARLRVRASGGAGYGG